MELCLRLLSDFRGDDLAVVECFRLRLEWFEVEASSRKTDPSKLLILFKSMSRLGEDEDFRRQEPLRLLRLLRLLLLLLLLQLLLFFAAEATVGLFCAKWSTVSWIARSILLLEMDENKLSVALSLSSKAVGALEFGVLTRKKSSSSGSSTIINHVHRRKQSGRANKAATATFTGVAFRPFVLGLGGEKAQGAKCVHQ